MASTCSLSTFVVRRLAPFVAILLAVVGPGLLAPAPALAEEPRIVFFRIVPMDRNGEIWHEFHWEVLDAERVRLFSDGREVESRSQLDDGSFGWRASMAGSMSMKLSSSRQFRLVAEGAGGARAERTVAVEVAATKPNPPPTPQIAARPEIKSFRASHRNAPRNKPVKLFWTTRNASAVSLFANGVEIETQRDLATVEAAGFQVSPDVTTSYLLIAENRDGRRASQEVKVGVVTVTQTAFCKIAGRVTGKWRQNIAQRPGGPESEWIVDMLLFKRGERSPKDQAKVRGGRYSFNRVPVEGSYFVSPSWKGQPNQVDVRNCRAGKKLRIRDIRITGGPLID